jgi:hypothetical protein
MTTRDKVLRREFDIRQNVYGRDVIFLYGTREALNRLLVREIDAGCTLQVASRGKWILHERDDGFLTDYIVLVKRTTHCGAAYDRVRQIAALAHEVNHHTFSVMQVAGIDAQRGSDEPFCYYAQWMMTQCLEAMK